MMGTRFYIWEATVIIIRYLILLIQSINLKCISDHKPKDLIANVCFCCRRYRQQGEVANIVASPPVVVFYRPELCQASLGEILHVVLHPVYCLDRCLLLRYGLDGECNIYGGMQKLNEKCYSSGWGVQIFSAPWSTRKLECLLECWNN